jgi:hypothetical protein
VTARSTFIQQQRVAQMAGLGAHPMPTQPDEYGDVLVLVTRGDGLPELKAIAPDGAVRSLTHPHEDRAVAVVA